MYRSTNLDTWQLAQLRNMKVGGNASANDFFNKHGVSSLLSDVDTKKKYSSRVGELYREELARRVKDDVTQSVVSTFHTDFFSVSVLNPPLLFYLFIRFPNGIVVDGMEAPTAALAKEETEDDFFDSWSKPSTPKSSNPGTPRISTPPIIGRSASAISTTANTNSTNPPNPPPSPRTLTSSAAARPSRLGATSRLNSASSGGSNTSSTIPKKSKLGLGAAKTKPVDFAEAERKAIEEAERIKQLGYDREQEEKEEKARKEIEALKRAQEIGSRAGIAASTTTTTVQATTNGVNKSAADPQKSAAFPRLGFGAIPGAGAAAAVAAAPITSKTKYIYFSFFFSSSFMR